LAETEPIVDSAVAVVIQTVACFWTRANGTDAGPEGAVRLAVLNTPRAFAHVGATRFLLHTVAGLYRRIGCPRLATPIPVRPIPRAVAGGADVKKAGSRTAADAQDENG
jgi:hypothetical protein